MAQFTGMELTRMFSNHLHHANPLHDAGMTVRFWNEFLSRRAGTLVAIVMSFPRAQYVMAHFAGRMIPRSQDFRGVARYVRFPLLFFCYWEKAGVFLNHPPLWAGATVRQLANRNKHKFLCCRTRVYLFLAENERRMTQRLKNHLSLRVAKSNPRSFGIIRVPVLSPSVHGRAQPVIAQFTGLEAAGVLFFFFPRNERQIA